MLIFIYDRRASYSSNRIEANTDTIDANKDTIINHFERKTEARFEIISELLEKGGESKDPIFIFHDLCL